MMMKCFRKTFAPLWGGKVWYSSGLVWVTLWKKDFLGIPRGRFRTRLLLRRRKGHSPIIRRTERRTSPEPPTAMAGGRFRQTRLGAPRILGSSVHRVRKMRTSLSRPCGHALTRDPQTHTQTQRLYQLQLLPRSLPRRRHPHDPIAHPKDGESI